MGSERWVEDSKSKATEQNTQWTKGAIPAALRKRSNKYLRRDRQAAVINCM